MLTFLIHSNDIIVIQNILVPKMCALQHLEVKINVLISTTYFQKVKGKKVHKTHKHTLGKRKSKCGKTLTGKGNAGARCFHLQAFLQA